MFCELKPSQLPDKFLPIVLQILKPNPFPILFVFLLLFQFLRILNHPASRAIQNGSVKALKDTIIFYYWKELKIPCFLHHDEDPKDIFHIALFNPFECSITATIQLAKCFPFLVSSNAPHCTNPWSVAAEWVSEMLLSVSVVYSHFYPTSFPWSSLNRNETFWLKNFRMFCWLCCWGWWHLVRVSSLWWCVEMSLWCGDKDLSLPGDVLWFWGWHCLAYSSWRFFEYTLIQMSSGTASRLRITRHPEWSSGLLRPCCNGIILYWIEWWGTSNLQRTRISAPGRANIIFNACC